MKKVVSIRHIDEKKIYVLYGVGGVYKAHFFLMENGHLFL